MSKSINDMTSKITGGKKGIKIFLPVPAFHFAAGYKCEKLVHLTAKKFIQYFSWCGHTFAATYGFNVDEDYINESKDIINLIDTKFYDAFTLADGSTLDNPSWWDYGRKHISEAIGLTEEDLNLIEQKGEGLQNYEMMKLYLEEGFKNSFLVISSDIQNKSLSNDLDNFKRFLDSIDESIDLRYTDISEYFSPILFYPLVQDSHRPSSEIIDDFTSLLVVHESFISGGLLANVSDISFFSGFSNGLRSVMSVVTVDSHRDILENLQAQVLTSMLDTSPYALFLNLYRMLETIYPYYRVANLLDGIKNHLLNSTKLDISSSYRMDSLGWVELANLVGSNLDWRPKERHSLEKILNLVDDCNLQLLKEFYLKRNPSLENSENIEPDKLAEYVYKVRNSYVHSESVMTSSGRENLNENELLEMSFSLFPVIVGIYEVLKDSSSCG